MAGIIDTLKLKYKTGSVMTRLIFINVAVFILLKVVVAVTLRCLTSTVST